MLILTRKVGERIRIGDEIEISIVEVKGRSVRIGVAAPKGMSVLREEVYKRICEENIRAAKGVASFEMIDVIGSRFSSEEKAKG